MFLTLKTRVDPFLLRLGHDSGELTESTRDSVRVCYYCCCFEFVMTRDTYCLMFEVVWGSVWARWCSAVTTPHHRDSRGGEGVNDVLIVVCGLGLDRWGLRMDLELMLLMLCWVGFGVDVVLMFLFAVGFGVDVVAVVLRFGFRFWLVFVFAKG